MLQVRVSLSIRVGSHVRADVERRRRHLVEWTNNHLHRHPSSSTRPHHQLPSSSFTPTLPVVVVTWEDGSWPRRRGVADWRGSAVRRRGWRGRRHHQRHHHHSLSIVSGDWGGTLLRLDIVGEGGHLLRRLYQGLRIARWARFVLSPSYA